jgi:acyl-coenzyme A thioesterase 13
MLKNMPFAKHIGFEFHPAGRGTSEVRLEVLPRHLNTQGTGHGGLFSILIDAAGTAAVLSRLTDVRVVTVDLRANLVGRLEPGDKVIARGTVSLVDGSTCYASAVVTNQDAVTIALGQLTCVLKRKGRLTPT